MPFYMYSVDGEYVRLRNNETIPLAGQEGPFRDKIVRESTREKSNPIEWELYEKELVAFYGVDPKQHAIVIDLKPQSKTEVSLYRLRHVWGYSSDGWTPMAFELECLYGDYKVQDVEVFKTRFPAPANSDPQVYEFLHLQADATGGRSWGFGRVGNVNATLLWPQVFDSFVRRINRRRQDQNLPPIGSLESPSSKDPSSQQ